MNTMTTDLITALQTHGQLHTVATTYQKEK